MAGAQIAWTVELGYVFLVSLFVLFWPPVRHTLQSAYGLE